MLWKFDDNAISILNSHTLVPDVHGALSTSAIRKHQYHFDYDFENKLTGRASNYLPRLNSFARPSIPPPARFLFSSNKLISKIL